MGRMYCLPLALLFLASFVPSNAQETTEALAPVSGSVSVVDNAEKIEFDVHRNLTLDCSNVGDAGAKKAWKINSTEFEKLEKGHQDRIKIGPNGDTLSVAKMTEDDWGVYTCVAGDTRRVWQALGRPRAVLNENYNVVEGQKIKIVCKLVGKPYPGVEWFYSNQSKEFTANSSRLELDDRIKVKPSAEQGVENAELVIDSAAKSDAGWYQCRPLNGTADVMLLRVKDMYAALWPFLGICAEVFVLCAIILVYEKRRTKPEMDDSDTDNHDQKKS